jgi:hypothetical protein
MALPFSGSTYVNSINSIVKWTVDKDADLYKVGTLVFRTEWAAKEYARFCNATEVILYSVQTTLENTSIYACIGSGVRVVNIPLSYSTYVSSRRGKNLVSFSDNKVDKINLSELLIVLFPVDLIWVKLCVVMNKLMWGTNGRKIRT